MRQIEITGVPQHQVEALMAQVAVRAWRDEKFATRVREDFKSAVGTVARELELRIPEASLPDGANADEVIGDPIGGLPFGHDEVIAGVETLGPSTCPESEYFTCYPCETLNTCIQSHCPHLC